MSALDLSRSLSSFKGNARDDLLGGLESLDETRSVLGLIPRRASHGAVSRGILRRDGGNGDERSGEERFDRHACCGEGEEAKETARAQLEAVIADPSSGGAEARRLFIGRSSWVTFSLLGGTSSMPSNRVYSSPSTISPTRIKHSLSEQVCRKSSSPL